MWPKIKFGAQIFVKDIISKVMGKTVRRTNTERQGRKKKWLLKDGYEVVLKCLKRATDKVPA